MMPTPILFALPSNPMQVTVVLEKVEAEESATVSWSMGVEADVAMGAISSVFLAERPNLSETVKYKWRQNRRDIKYAPTKIHRNLRSATKVRQNGRS